VHKLFLVFATFFGLKQFLSKLGGFGRYRLYHHILPSSSIYSRKKCTHKPYICSLSFHSLTLERLCPKRQIFYIF